jgi:hypothetical protein
MMTDYIEYEVKVYSNGTQYWYFDDKLHRENGPAIEYANGNKYWYLNGKRHREDGPAVEGASGDKSWYLNGNLHREDGPAIEWSNGTKFWYLDDERLTEEDFNERMAPTVEMTVAQISEALGKNVKVVK